MSKTQLAPNLNVEEVFRMRRCWPSAVIDGVTVWNLSRPYIKPRIFLTIVERFYRLTTRHSGLFGSLERTIGTTTKCTYASSIHLRTQFVASPPGTGHYYWRTCKLQRVDSSKPNLPS